MKYLSRVRLKTNASIRALAPLLSGRTGRGGPNRQAGHHLMWSLFADTADRTRDFLWRDMDEDTFLILSARLPEDHHGLFEIDDPKEFTPVLKTGDRLKFSLRANAVVRKRDRSKGKSAKHDVVMNALREHEKEERASQRLKTIQGKGFEWLARQGESAGFGIEARNMTVEGYDQHHIYRARLKTAMMYSTLDFEGILTVNDPDALMSSIAQGFGSTKAYGCGLMLIKRA